MEKSKSDASGKSHEKGKSADESKRVKVQNAFNEILRRTIDEKFDPGKTLNTCRGLSSKDKQEAHRNVMKIFASMHGPQMKLSKKAAAAAKKKLLKSLHKSSVKRKPGIQKHSSSNGSKKSGVEKPPISRSGRVLKRSDKLKQMVDCDINELDDVGKPHVKVEPTDEFEKVHDKQDASKEILSCSKDKQLAHGKILKTYSEKPQISASGRVLKRSAKVKQMQDSKSDVTGKSLDKVESAIECKRVKVQNALNEILRRSMDEKLAPGKELKLYVGVSSKDKQEADRNMKISASMHEPIRKLSKKAAAATKKNLLKSTHKSSVKRKPDIQEQSSSNVSKKSGVEEPQISRSGRVLTRSAKVKQLENFDINKLDVSGTSRDKVEPTDEFEKVDDKQVASKETLSCSQDKQVAHRNILKTKASVHGTKNKTGEMATAAGGKQVLETVLESSVKGKPGVQEHSSSNLSKKSGVEKPQISRSGRVLKRSGKVKQIEDSDINMLDDVGKSHDKVGPTDDFEKADDEQVASREILSCSKDKQLAHGKILKTYAGVKKPQISRSGQVLKRSDNVKDIEDFDINKLDDVRKSDDKVEPTDEFEKLDDDQVASKKILSCAMDKQLAHGKILKAYGDMYRSQKKMGEMATSAVREQVLKTVPESSVKGKSGIPEHSSLHGSKKSAVESPQISRSEQALKKSDEVKEMAEFDINKSDAVGKSHDKVIPTDEFKKVGDDQVASKENLSFSEDNQLAPGKVLKTYAGIYGSKRKMGEMAGKKQALKSILKRHPSSIKKSVSFRMNIRTEYLIERRVPNRRVPNGKVRNGSVPRHRFRVRREPDLASLIASKALADSENVVIDSDAEEELIRLTDHYATHYPVVYPPDYEEIEKDAYEESRKEKLAEGLKEIIPLPEYMPWLPNIYERYVSSARRIGLKSIAERQHEAWKHIPELKEGNIETGYLLWCRDNFNRIFSSVERFEDFEEFEKKMREAWEEVPEIEKNVWERRAKQAALKYSVSNTQVSSRTKARDVLDVMKHLTYAFRNPNFALEPVRESSISRLNFIKNSLDMVSYMALAAKWKSRFF